MKLLNDIVAWVRCAAHGLWNALAPGDQARAAVGTVVDVVRRRRELVIENAMLRQQIIVLRRTPPHPKFTTFDRLRLVVAARMLPTWRGALSIVQPQTVLRWHREGFPPVLASPFPRSDPEAAACDRDDRPDPGA